MNIYSFNVVSEMGYAQNLDFKIIVRINSKELGVIIIVRINSKELEVIQSACRAQSKHGYGQGIIV
ncbi:hypothetical protein [Candidatus Parabeggiatoa sp. HSG14]|uniref:hypothetical protein n=1 Tax=Candidatus Parabeggiatoa sp. HSG14 TaxID=3055593 RepID=UPI0025A81F3C|nr:hypothetical protein [Thiotrichales bacterium HSG14]